MSSVEAQRSSVNATGYAAFNASGHLSPYAFALRETGAEDVVISVMYCGICHTDLHLTRNENGMSRYPMVPGHEVVGKVTSVGSEVTKFKAGDIVGVGCIVGCCRSCRQCELKQEQYCSRKIWTYNDVYYDGTPTYGGFANLMVADQMFVVKVPENLPPEQAAPMLCAGVTVYSPLKHFGMADAKIPKRIAIVGLGGVGHVGVKLYKAFGHHVTVISSSDKKRKEALEVLGADDYIISSDSAKMHEAKESMDMILDMVPVKHDLQPYLNLLNVDGALVMLGVVSEPLQFVSPLLMLGRRSITGSFIGSMEELEEVLKICAIKEVRCMIEKVQLEEVNKAMERLEKNDVRYRFVVDVAGSKSISQN
eukprot:TRINITY_DN3137_c0_g1_i2.p1 TRINITY_DN3137_c0_g1~~TRINITY_DN3137_c0_g1_i2.p1  ORF type:complete len:365 (+),score=57.64 TRINITY_DN3137_c0_g1_i2:112-1206(+)